ncbi:MAG: hypothetical protein WD772_01030 [Pseudohongiellaceae bacterium]
MQKLNESVGVSSPVSRTVDKATDSVHHTINSATEKSHPAIDRIAAGAHHATDRIGEATTHAASAIDHKSDQFMDAEARLLANVREFIQEKPLSALGIALGAGYVLNWWLQKR